MINRKNLIDFPNFIMYRFDSREFSKKYFLKYLYSIIIQFLFSIRK